SSSVSSISAAVERSTASDAAQNADRASDSSVAEALIGAPSSEAPPRSVPSNGRPAPASPPRSKPLASESPPSKPPPLMPPPWKPPPPGKPLPSGPLPPESSPPSPSGAMPSRSLMTLRLSAVSSEYSRSVGSSRRSPRLKKSRNSLVVPYSIG